ncbi:MAG: ABC transporter permease [Planctomycetes bacterium]|nr:ABC transporter permease [Planctomycetota bacterium]
MNSSGLTLSSWRRNGIWLGLVLLCLFFTLATDRFWGRENFLNILRQISILSVLAVGATFVILTAGIDLSVGSVLAVSAMVMAKVFHGFPESSHGYWLGLAAGLGVGLLFGLANGLIVTLGGIHSFVATLGTMAIGRSVARVLHGGREIGHLPDRLAVFAEGYWGPLPVPVLLMAAVYGGAYATLRWTRFGRLVYALGSNREACRLTGVPVRRCEVGVYALAGLLAALGGIIVTSRVGSAEPRAGLGIELEVIAAVVVGGTSLAGGRGGVLGTLCGALLMGVLGNGLNLLDVNTDWQGVVVGSIVIAAVVLDRWGRDRKGVSL